MPRNRYKINDYVIVGEQLFRKLYSILSLILKYIVTLRNKRVIYYYYFDYLFISSCFLFHSISVL